MELGSITKLKVVGWAILITMLAVSFLLLPVLLSQMDGSVLPEKGMFLWFAMCAFVLAFPVMAAHFYVMVMRKYMKWLSYWFVVVTATLGLVFLYRLTMVDRVSGGHTDRVTVFVSCFVGGTLGGMIVLGIVRRFKPHWLSVNAVDRTSQIKHRIGLKTIFGWTAAIAIIAASLTDRDDTFLEKLFNDQVYVGQLIGALSVGFFCAFVLLPALGWLRSACPLWLGKLSLSVCSLLLPITVCGVVAKFTFGGDAELPMLAVSLSFVLFWLSVYAIVWETGCRWAGVTEPNSIKHIRSGVFKYVDTIFTGLGKVAKYAVFAIAVSFILFSVGWGFIHFFGGEERNVELINHKIHDLIGSQDKDVDWIDVFNDQRSAGITAENNVAVKVIKIFNPYPLVQRQVDVNSPSEYSLVYNDSDRSQREEIERLGLTLESLVNLPVLNVHSWFYGHVEAFQVQLRDAHPDIAAKYDMAPQFDAGGGFGFGQPTEKLPSDSEQQETQKLSKAQKLAKFFIEQGVDPNDLIQSPWTADDCSLGADFLQIHQPQIAELIELSKESTYYAPLTRTNSNKISPNQFGYRLLKTPFFLLEASGYFNIGNDDIDAAIENCESIWRFTKMASKGADTLCLNNIKSNADDLAKAIVFSGSASESQMRRLLKWSLLEEGGDSFSRAKTFSKIMQYDQAYHSLTSPDSNLVYHSTVPSPIMKLYATSPRLTNWRSFIDAFETLSESCWGNYRAVVAGELSGKEYDARKFDLLSKTLPNGRKIGLNHYHFFFDQQLSVLMRGPVAKGEMLAEFSASQFWHYDAVQHRKLSRETNKIAIALEIYKAKCSVYPDQLRDLVPDILPVIEKDPLTMSEFVYRREQADFKLYSIGHNMIDDGGDHGETDDLVFFRPLKDFSEYVEAKTSSK